MKHDFCAELDDILIRPLHRYDIEYLREWRNDSEIGRFLRPIEHITEQMQEDWFGSYLEEPDVYYFAIDFKKKRTVGSLALYDFDDNRCQIGRVMIGDSDAHGHGVARCAFLMAMGIANTYLDINEFYLSVHEDNLAARKIYDKLGFHVTDKHPFVNGGSEYEMILDALKARSHDDAIRILFYMEDLAKKRRWKGIVKNGS